MKLLNFFKRKNTFQVGQFCKVWVYAESTEAKMYAEITGIAGHYISVKFLDHKKMAWLLQTDPSFIFPEQAHFKDCRHVAYDQMDYCYMLQKLNQKQ